MTDITFFSNCKNKLIWSPVPPLIGTRPTYLVFIGTFFLVPHTFQPLDFSRCMAPKFSNHPKISLNQGKIDQKLNRQDPIGIYIPEFSIIVFTHLSTSVLTNESHKYCFHWQCFKFSLNSNFSRYKRFVAEPTKTVHQQCNKFQIRMGPVNWTFLGAKGKELIICDDNNETMCVFQMHSETILLQLDQGLETVTSFFLDTGSVFVYSRCMQKLSFQICWIFIFDGNDNTWTNPPQTRSFN